MKKIATVTLHLPNNYGNALQTFALHKFLNITGYKTDVLSCWFFQDQDEIQHTRNLLKKGLIGWINLLCRYASFTGYFLWSIREHKLKKWLTKNICWSNVSGSIANFPTDKINYTLLIAGSDQIWNPVHDSSKFYLLDRFPKSIKKISYAASFGSDIFPKSLINSYKDALSSFSAISTREISGKKILDEEININAEYVVDPTLLLTKQEWISLLDIKTTTEKKEIFFYFVTPDTTSTFPIIIDLAKKTKLAIHVFFQNVECPIFPPKIKTILKVWKFRIQSCFMNIHIHLTATPSEFLQKINDCEFIITDSFHGMMFSTIFEKKASIIIGENQQRKQMSSRIYDFTQNYGFTKAISKTIIIPRTKLFITPKLTNQIKKSKSWLIESVITSI